MKQNEKAGLKGFNIDFEDHFPGYEGELNEAKFAASNNGIDLIEENISYQEFQALLNNYSFYQDDLVGDEVGIPLYFLGKKTRTSNIKVVQVGEGADELFYGYDHWNRFLSLNKLLKPFFQSSKKHSRFKNHRLNLISNILFNRTSFAGGALGFNLKELDSLIVGGLPNDSDLIYYADNKWSEYFSQKNSKISKWMTLIDLKIRLPELLLMRMDKLVMQSAVEARVPFLDHKLVEYVLSLPEDLLIDLSTTKSLLKKVASKYLPEQIVNRKKQGFRAPIGEWIKKDEKKFHESVQQFNSLVNLFNERELNQILSGKDYQKKWYLINLSNWHLARVAN
jgi:asparagine synthase (glutamine-hydrolysing)